MGRICRLALNGCRSIFARGERGVCGGTLPVTLPAYAAISFVENPPPPETDFAMPFVKHEARG
jgi:hypothetical protein